MRTCAALLLALAATTACALGMQAQGGVEPGIDFSRYRSFSVLPISPSALDGRELRYGDFDEQALVTTVALGLEARGYDEAALRDADLIVRIRAATRERTFERQVLGSMGAGVEVVEYLVIESTLGIEAFDAATRDRVFSSSVTGSAQMEARPDIGKRLDRAARAILERFPEVAE